MKKRCRTVMTPNQSRILRKVLEQTAFPSTEIREGLAKMLGMKPRTVQIWFQNQRQKTRQGRSQSDDSISSGTDNDTVDADLDENENSSASSFSPQDSTNRIGANFTPSPPSFNALTAAAFALSNTTPLEGTSYDSQAQLQSYSQPPQQPTRYSNFHGAVFKSTPGCIPTPSFRGNTATAMNNRRLAAAASSIQTSPNQFMMSHQNFLPNQPQTIPSYPQQQQQHRPVINSLEGIPLDILAAAVSNFRPNGYNYHMQQSSVRSPPPPPLLLPTPNPSERNRLAPIRTSSPPSTSPIMDNNSSFAKLPSLKALAQVASIGMEMEAGKNRRNSASAEATSSTNSVAPNENSNSVSARRPW